MSAYFALWANVVIAAIAQIVLKLAVTGPLAQTSARSTGWWFSLLRSGWIWLYVLCFNLATGLWLFALSQLNISLAFPLLSATYVLVALLARIFLKERVTGTRWAAIAVICIGVAVIAWS